MNKCGYIKIVFAIYRKLIMNNWRISSFYKVNFFMYVVNLIPLVKPYRHDVCAVIWHSSKL